MSLSNRIFSLLQQHGPLGDHDLMAELPPDTKPASFRRSRQTLVKQGLISALPGTRTWTVARTPAVVSPPALQPRVVN